MSKYCDRSGNLTSGAPNKGEPNLKGLATQKKPGGDTKIQLGSLRKNEGGRFSANETAGTRKK